MKKTLPWVLLAVSFAFNIFFLVGMIRAQRHHALVMTPEGRARLLAQKLGMDADQSARCLALEKEISAERDALSEKTRPQYEAFWAEIVKDHPDEATLEEFVQGASGADRRRCLVRHMRGLMQILRPEQRQQAADFFKGLRYRVPR